jgi:hypothetical protein
MQENESFADLQPILWKWLIRLIWVGSIGFFQAAELHRYSGGLTYRPFFALYTGILVALVTWFVVHTAAETNRRRHARRQSRSTAA